MIASRSPVNPVLKQSLGIESYANLDNKIESVKRQSNLLANGVSSVLGFSLSKEYLEVIYVPFLSHLNQFSDYGILDRSNSAFFKDFDEFYNFGFGNECQSPFKWREQLVHYKEGCFDVIFPGPVNIYERVVYAIRNISFLELKYTDSNEKNVLIPDLKLRRDLKKQLAKYANEFPCLNTVDYLPLSLLEGIQSKSYLRSYPVAKYHWLGSLHHEDYLFFLAYLKEKGTIIISQPHGGVYCQMHGCMGAEIADRILADIYYSPLWMSKSNIFPNLRASRNLFLNFKFNTFRKEKIKKKKMLVLLSYFYIGKEPAQSMLFTGKTSLNDFYHRQLRDLKNHFDASLDFKLYPRQDCSFLTNLEYLKQLYPGCKFITKSSVHQLASRYDGVIHIDTWGTAIIELAATRTPQYVYLGPDILINKGYELFLWNIKKSSSRADYSKGAYVQIDNPHYIRAYGASYFYPFHFANLVK